MFGTYFQLGIDHILDLQGYDHILFIIALCAVYDVKEWKKVLILATAFTLGHSLTLALSALDMVSFSSRLIEILIPVTIILTAVSNMLRQKNSVEFKTWHYLLPLIFGLIHGLGFSTFFRALMGTSSEVLLPLFAFNVGVEIGQIVIIILTMILSYILIDKFKMKRIIWNYGVSIIAILVSLYLIYEKLV